MHSNPTSRSLTTTTGISGFVDRSAAVAAGRSKNCCDRSVEDSVDVCDEAEDGVGTAEVMSSSEEAEERFRGLGEVTCFLAFLAVGWCLARGRREAGGRQVPERTSAYSSDTTKRPRSRRLKSASPSSLGQKNPRYCMLT
jgi:hypothetical protein